MWLAVRSVTALGAAGIQPAPTIATIQVQGNVLTSDAEMRQLTGVEIGAPFTADLTDVVTERLKNTRKFESIQVLKRFASIADWVGATHWSKP